ncbi:hypothetical protein M5W83_02130 [Paenibacillus thiaminolyticus]|uniref:Uncharacterized protein n=1 Tax=Paenibacillus thiaminolyticus TaxID=49283 RepID=A0AAP9DT65_PANTH|nr:hypothetical protein [Paenibacillus thiaminolyticus]MCY9538186.1 hypothetical protein [Paenibacillus thiaminolyticus]MCY9602164.1 hypothetical protein [Paenibacillus thiaminolyticus]MCY9605976.1 hypothetical protein [Paenibacillus thiaminolyticus]MCY9612383.1 hypothetical protein [Paenibacillus thiaminolyticus]MCY9621172.1 hypothetical protein [Paenibacillus thiaminolyticus]
MLEEVKSVEQLKIGKKIRCHYRAIANTLGTFSGLGKETSDFISPTTSSAAPNGDFYFICVDKDHLSRWKLIADRNIEHSISWDTLNSAGVASGSGLPVRIDNEIDGILRLLTGGIDENNKDNEWDKYINNGESDHTKWNLANNFAWTSTTSFFANNNSPAYRTMRGGSSEPGYLNSYPSDAKTLLCAFRPMLLITSLSSPSFVCNDNLYKTYDKEWKPISTTLPSKDTFMNDGISDLSVFDRKEQTVSLPMTSSVLGEGKVFKAKVDYKKYFDINRIDVK